MGLFYRLILVGALFLSTITPGFSQSAESENQVKEVPSSLQNLFDDCDADIFGFEDYALCPRAEKYVFKKMTLKGVKDYFSGYELTESTSSKAAQLIAESMEAQADAILENGSNDTDEEIKATREAYDSFKKSIARISNVLRRLPKTNKIYVDATTYWAPSVNARAVFIINEKKKSVTVVLHGDTDG